MNPPKSIPPGAVLIALLTGTFVGTLGNSMTNVTLPAIMTAFAVPLSSAIYVVTLYGLLFAVLMPVCGYLGDLYGQRRIYLLGMALFGVGTLGSALSPSLPWLLGSRALQGIAAAPILPAIMTMLARTVPPERRGRALGLWALANGAAHSLGPPLSGFLIDHWGWRAVFLFPVPLCLLNILAVWRLAPPDTVPTTRPFDFGGAATLTVAAMGTMVALTQSSRWGWSAPLSLALWGLSLAALVTFLLIERRARAPFVDLRLFSNQSYTAATLVIGAQLFCLFGLLLVLPVFLIQGQGYSSQSAGLIVLPLPLTMAVIAPLAGRLADTWGTRRTSTGGMALIAVGGIVITAFQAGTGLQVHWAAIAGSLVVVGVGMGLVQSPTTAAVTRIIEPQRLGVATGIFHMVRFISGTLGSTVFGLIVEGHPGGIGRGLQRDLVILVGLALAAIIVAQRLPSQKPGF
jgi:EmrB/QacA subfamily drug resistance transporter